MTNKIDELKVEMGLDTKPMYKDLKKAEKDIKAFQKKIEKGKPMEISIDADMSGLKDVVKETNRLLSSIRDTMIELNVDTSNVKSGVRTANQILNGLDDVNIEINADASDVDKKAGKVKTMLESIPDVKIDVDADVTDALGNISRFESELSSLPSRVGVNVDADTAGAMSDLRRLQSELDGLKSGGKVEAPSIVPPVVGGIAVANSMNKSGDYIESKNKVESKLGEVGVEKYHGILDGASKTGKTGSFDETAELIGNYYGANHERSKQTFTKAEGVEEVKAVAELEKVGLGDARQIGQAVSTLQKEYGLTNKQALSYLIKGQKEGLNYSDDFLDTLNEYSMHYKKLGLNSTQMFESIKLAQDDGAFNTDYVGDMYKEFGIQSSEALSKEQETGLALLGAQEAGLDADKVIDGMMLSEKMTKADDKGKERIRKKYGAERVDGNIAEYEKATQFSGIVEKGLRAGGSEAEKARAMMLEARAGVTDKYEQTAIDVQLLGGTKTEDNAGKGAEQMRKVFNYKGDHMKNDGGDSDRVVDEYANKATSFNELMLGFGQDMTIALQPVMDDLLKLGETVLPQIVDVTENLVKLFGGLDEGTRKWALALGLIGGIIGPILLGMLAISKIKGVVDNGIKGMIQGALGIEPESKQDKKGKKKAEKDAKKNKGAKANTRVGRRPKGRVGLAVEMVRRTSEALGGVGSDITKKKKVDKPKANKSTGNTSKLLKGAKLASRTAVPVTLALGVADIATSDNKSDAVSRTAGAGLGGWGGATAGAAIGTAIFPGVGTVVGGAIGGLLGAGAGEWIGGKMNELAEYMGGLDGLKNKWGDMTSYLGEKSGEAMAISKELWSSGVTAIKEEFFGNLQSVKDFLGTSVDWIGEKLSSGTEWWKGVIGSGFDFITGKINTKLTESKNFINGILASIGETFGINTEGIQNTVSQGFEKVRSFIVDPIEKAKLKVMEILNSIKQAFADLKLNLPKVDMSGFKLPDFIADSAIGRALSSEKNSMKESDGRAYQTNQRPINMTTNIDGKAVSQATYMFDRNYQERDAGRNHRLYV